MTMPTVSALPTTRDAILSLIADGKFFSVDFLKRDGSLRTMQARLGVQCHLKGGEKAFSDAEKGIITVYSTDANGYRSVRVDSIRSLTAQGCTYAA